MSDLATKSNGRAAEPAARAVTATPPVDVFETEHEFLVLADMPGVKPADVDVRYERGELAVHGRREPAHAGKEAAVREYETAGYFRSFTVADTIAADKISAELKDGVLTVRLPKVEAVKPKRIAVRG